MKPGDVVKLKSGSLPMTINKDVEINVECVWFDNYNDLKQGIFAKGALVEVS